MIGPVMTVREAVDQYMMMRVTEGAWLENSDTYSHNRKFLIESFCSLHGSHPLRNVTTAEIRTWNANLRHGKTGEPLSILTKRHYLIGVKCFFRRCWREGWIERDPTLPIVLPSIPDEDVAVIPVRSAWEVFRINRDHRSIGRLALEAFGGIRYSTAMRLTLDDIKFSRRGIEMPSTAHKSRKRRFRQGQPPNCWKWLDHASREGWSIHWRSYRDDKREMHVLARLRPLVLKSKDDREKARDMKNVWRHSFASYHLALQKEFSATAYLMQHNRTTTTEVYEGVADETDAKLYFNITPETVLMSWDQFVEVTLNPPQKPAVALPPPVVYAQPVLAAGEDWRAG